MRRSFDFLIGIGLAASVLFGAAFLSCTTESDNGGSGNVLTLELPDYYKAQNGNCDTVRIDIYAEDGRLLREKFFFDAFSGSPHPSGSHPKDWDKNLDVHLIAIKASKVVRVRVIRLQAGKVNGEPRTVEAPSWKSLPSTQTLPRGGRAVFTAEALGEELTYRWKEGENIFAQGSSRLEIAAEGSPKRDFTVEVQDRYGRILVSPVFHLEIPADTGTGKDSTAADKTGPTLRLASAQLDGSGVSASSKKVEIFALDPNGIGSVKFTLAGKEFPASWIQDSLYAATLTGLSPGKNEIVVSAEDGSVNRNQTTLRFSLNFDSTLSDRDPPTLVLKSGPRSGERVRSARGEIVVTVKDPGRVDSVTGYKNGISIGALSKEGQDDHRLSYDLGTHYRMNRLVVQAVDGSIHRNRDSLVLHLDFNTPPSASILIGPQDNSSGIENAGTPVKITWTPSVDVDGDTVKNRIQYGLASQDLKTQVTGGSGEASLSGLLGDTVYYWRLQTISGADTLYLPASGAYRFRTRNHPPSLAAPLASQKVSIRDTVRFTAAAIDAEEVRQYHWEYKSQGQTRKQTTAGGTVSFVAGAGPSIDSVILFIEDGKGRIERAGVALVTVELSPPSCNAGADRGAGLSNPVTLKGTAQDQGRIVSYEWSLDGRPFQNAPNGELNFTSPDSLNHNFRCVLRVTDDDGLQAIDTVKIDVQMVWEVAGQLGVIGQRGGHTDGSTQGAILVRDGIAYAFGPDTMATSVDGATWTKRAYNPPFKDLWGTAFCVHRGSFFASGGRSRDRQTWGTMYRSENGIEWTTVTTNSLVSRTHHSLVSFRDSLWIIGGINYLSNSNPQTYVSDDGSFSSGHFFGAPPPEFSPSYGVKIIEFGNKLWAIGGRTSSTNHAGAFVSNNGRLWTESTIPEKFAGEHALAVFDGKIWLFHGVGISASYEITQVPIGAIYYSADGYNWKLATDNLTFAPRYGASAFQIGGKYFISGGTAGFRYENNPDSYPEILPRPSVMKSTDLP